MCFLLNLATRLLLEFFVFASFSIDNPVQLIYSTTTTKIDEALWHKIHVVSKYCWLQGDEAEKGDVAATEKEDEDEPSNLQLAWEMLELAKNILVKQSENLEKAEGAAKDADKERKDKVNSRICDTFQTLGELSIENENYPQVVIFNFENGLCSFYFLSNINQRTTIEN